MKDEIFLFELIFKKVVGISDRFLIEWLVDFERVDSYEIEINILENRWKNLWLKIMDNGVKWV